MDPLRCLQAFANPFLAWVTFFPATLQLLLATGHLEPTNARVARTPTDGGARHNRRTRASLPTFSSCSAVSPPSALHSVARVSLAAAPGCDMAVLGGKLRLKDMARIRKWTTAALTRNRKCSCTARSAWPSRGSASPPSPWGSGPPTAASAHRTRVGDFGLNAASPLTAAWYRQRWGLQGVTASYDLAAQQLVPPSCSCASLSVPCPNLRH